VCNFECLGVADARPDCTRICAEESLCAGGEGRFSATHCETANGGEHRNVHEVREKSGYRRCRCVHFHIYFSHEIVQIRQARRSALKRNLKWLLYVPPDFTQKDCTFCIQSECMCFVWFSVPKWFLPQCMKRVGARIA